MSRIWKIFCLFWAVSIIAGEVVVKHDTNFCPTFCHCDLYEEYNRADCSNQKLITAAIDIPQSVEILHLDDNDINVLEDNCFEGLTHLVNLTLSHNGIHTIFLNTFSDMKKLVFIDLSYNRLEFFDERIFENNRVLDRIDLSGNKFMSLNDNPLIISASVQHLILYQSQIPELKFLMFKKMPELRELDLSDNLMIDILNKTLTEIGELKYLDLRNNKWTRCHDDLRAIVKQLRSKGVEVKIDVCNPDDEKKMFERMMALPDSEMTTKRTPDDITNVWKHLKSSSSSDDSTNVICSAENLKEICELHQLCTNAYMKLVDEINTPSPDILKAQSDAIYVALYAGLFLGIFITLSLVYTMYSICTARRRSHRKIRIPPAPQQLIQNIQRNETQITRRDQIPANRIRPISREANIRRNPNGVRRTFVRLNRGDFFLSSIFERPVRRQLISNPVQHEQLTHVTRDTDPLISGNSSIDSVQESPISEAIQNNHRIDEEIFQVPENNLPPRGETPPPAYNEIVDK